MQTDTLTFSTTIAPGLSTTYTAVATWPSSETIATAVFEQAIPPLTVSYSVSSQNGKPLLIPLSSSATSGVTFTPTPGSSPSLSITPSTPITSTTTSRPTSAPASTRPSQTTTSSTNSNIPAPAANTGQKLHSSDVSKGAAAGIGVGCAAIGALLAAIGVWLLMRKRGRLSRLPSALEKRRLADEGKNFRKGYHDSTTVTALQTMHPNTIDRIIPQPLDENTISRDFSKLGTAIKNHAQTYYASERNYSAKGDTSTIQRLLGSGSPLDDGVIANMLTRSDSRVIAARYLIAWLIIQNIDDDLLPPGVAICMKSMTGLTHDPKGRAACLGRWRAISALLMQDHYGQPQLSPNDPRLQHANELADALDSVLRPFASNSYSHEERLSNLRSVIQRAVRYGFTLFSQPSSWDFDWGSVKEKGSNNMVVFPELLQVTDEHGNAFPNGRCVVQREYANSRYKN